MILALLGALQILLALRVVRRLVRTAGVAGLKSPMGLGPSTSALSFQFLTRQRGSELVLNVSWLNQKQLKKFW